MALLWATGQKLPLHFLCMAVIRGGQTEREMRPNLGTSEVALAHPCARDTPVLLQSSIRISEHVEREGELRSAEFRKRRSGICARKV